MGNPFVHIELATEDLAAAKKFYKKLFEWDLSDMPGMDYTMVGVGKGTGGGMTHSQSQPAWLPYVEVVDVKKTLEKARRAGAKVLVERTPIGTDGTMGAFGVFLDPAGASLGVWETRKTPTPAAKKKKAAITKKKARRRS